MGSKEGAKKASITNRARYGEDWYKKIGSIGGSKCRPETRAFAVNPELARRAGAKGGRISRRGPAKPKHVKHIEVEYAD